MSLIVTPQPIDSSFVHTVTSGVALSAGRPHRPAANEWYLVFSRHEGRRRVVAVGPWTAPGTAVYPGDAQVLWVAMRLGAFMPHLPVERYLDRELPLPEAGERKFWLQGSAWEMPDAAHVDVFVRRLVRQGLLTRDPLVQEVLSGARTGVAERTVRARFKRATGLTHKHVLQVMRAQQAADQLGAGWTIPDVVAELDFYDQSHLTHALRRWLGVTPARLRPQP